MYFFQNGVIIINTYSEGICCIDYIDHTNEEICKKYIITPVTIPKLETINIGNDKSPDLGYHELSESGRIKFTKTNIYNYSEKSNLLNNEETKEPVLYIIGNNKILNENNRGTLIYYDNIMCNKYIIHIINYK